MRTVNWERFVPDFEDNRKRHQRGEPAVIVPIRPPSASLWRFFWQKMAERPRPIPEHLLPAPVGHTDREREERERIEAALTLYLATLDDSLAEILFLGCVGDGIEWPAELTPGFVPKNGNELWAARSILDSFKLYQSILEALVNRARLEEGLTHFLASAPGPDPSEMEENTHGGTAVTANVAD